MSRINGASMFACAGIGETYFKKAGIDVVVANELLENRAKFYMENHPDSKMIIGDCTSTEIKEELTATVSYDPTTTTTGKVTATIKTNKKVCRNGIPK